MSITIDNIEQASPGEWDRIWGSCPYSTYFHSREWSEIWVAYRDDVFQASPILIGFSDGKAALLPLTTSEILRGLKQVGLTSPARNYGGWISSDDLDVTHASLLTEYLMQRMGNLIWRVNPYDLKASAIADGIGFQDETHAVDLSEGPDSVKERCKKSLIRAVSKAGRQGVTIRQAEGLGDWTDYYAVYEDTLRRWRERDIPVFEVYPWQLFEEIFNRYSPSIKLWLAICEGKVIAGALCFYAPQHAVYWHGAALEEYFPRRPVNLLLFEAIMDACENNYRWFDLNPSGGNEGVKAFKKTFGAKEMPCPVIKIETLGTRVLKGLRDRVRQISG